MKNARTIVIALLATSFIAAGCGSDDSDSSSTSTPAASTQTTATEVASTDTTPAETATTDTGTATTDVPASADAAVKAGIAACKQAVTAQAATAPDLVDDLNKLCDKITDAEGAKTAVKEICTKIVEKNVPAGAARDQALTACKTA